MMNDEENKVDIDFEFYDPNDNQYHSVKALINGYLDGDAYNLGEVADIICKQVIKHNIFNINHRPNGKAT